MQTLQLNGSRLIKSSPHKSQLRLEQVSLKAPIGSHYLLNDISFEVFLGGRFWVVVGGIRGVEN